MYGIACPGTRGVIPQYKSVAFRSLLPLLHALSLMHGTVIEWRPCRVSCDGCEWTAWAASVMPLSTCYICRRFELNSVAAPSCFNLAHYHMDWSTFSNASIGSQWYPCLQIRASFACQTSEWCFITWDSLFIVLTSTFSVHFNFVMFFFIICTYFYSNVH